VINNFDLSVVTKQNVEQFADTWSKWLRKK
jgi:hypothetical protein